MFKGHLLLAPVMLKLFFSGKFLSTIGIGPKMAVFGEKGVQMLNFGFMTPKRHMRRTASFDVFCINVHGGVLAVGKRKNPQKIAE